MITAGCFLIAPAVAPTMVLFLLLLAAATLPPDFLLLCASLPHGICCAAYCMGSAPSRCTLLPPGHAWPLGTS